MSGLQGTGLKALKQEMACFEQKEKELLQEFLLEQAQTALENIRAQMPQEQEALSKAWRIDTESASLEMVQRQGDTLLIALSNPLPQASVVEYGALNADRSQFIPGRLICTLALAELEEQMPQRFQAAFAKWIGG